MDLDICLPLCGLPIYFPGPHMLCLPDYLPPGLVTGGWRRKVVEVGWRGRHGGDRLGWVVEGEAHPVGSVAHALHLHDG